MALPVTPAFVESVGALFPQLFNFNTGVPATDQANLDAFVLEAINDADAWMQIHMGGNYNLLDAPSARLQAKGQACLALEDIYATLKTEKVLGSNYPIWSEEGPSYQQLIDLNWGERALVYLDTWVTVEVGATRAFAMPQFLVTQGIDTSIDQTIESMTQQYSEELDFARGISNPDLGTVRR